MKKLLILMLLIVGCGVASRSYDLSSMPKYDMKVATENWEPITEAEQKMGMLQMMMMMVGDEVKPTKTQKDKFAKLYDEFLYWKAVAELQIFNGDYEMSKKSALRASDAVDGMAEVVAGLGEKI